MLKLYPEPDQARALAEHPLGDRGELDPVVERDHLDPMTRADQSRRDHADSEVLLAVRADECYAHVATSGRPGLASRMPPSSGARNHGELGGIVPECATLCQPGGGKEDPRPQGFPDR